MGVDTGKALHVVILRDIGESFDRQRLIFLRECHEFGELDELIRRFHVDRCVIDGLPETHATREFAKRHPGVAYMSYFVQSQRGGPQWDESGRIVQINRTDALDASRAAVRDSQVTLPARTPIVEEFAKHMAADAKVLDEDEETGAKKYRYIRTGTDHFSLAFTYACMAATSYGNDRGFQRWIQMQRREASS